MATSHPAEAATRPEAPTLGMYVCSVGAAAAITVFDGVTNERAAALQKFGGWFSRLLAGSDLASAWFLAALLFFCLFAALVTFAYRPAAHKEAFLLGAGILALLNALVKPPDTVRATESGRSDTKYGLVDFLLPSAFAQSSVASTEMSRVYIGVQGISDKSAAETSITIYDANTGAPVLSRSIGQSTALDLVPGTYNVFIARPGYRSVVFHAPVKCCSALFQPLLDSDKFDRLTNLFGPKLAAVRNDTDAALSLSAAERACQTSNYQGAQSARREIDRKTVKPFTSDPITSRQFCWN